MSEPLIDLTIFLLIVLFIVAIFMIFSICKNDCKECYNKPGTIEEAKE